MNTIIILQYVLRTFNKNNIQIRNHFPLAVTVGALSETSKKLVTKSARQYKQVRHLRFLM